MNFFRPLIRLVVKKLVIGSGFHIPLLITAKYIDNQNRTSLHSFRFDSSITKITKFVTKQLSLR